MAYTHSPSHTLAAAITVEAYEYDNINQWCIKYYQWWINNENRCLHGFFFHSECVNNINKSLSDSEALIIIRIAIFQSQ